MKEYVCCICGKHECGWGNNPEGAAWKTEDDTIVFPTFEEDDECCDECNSNYVIPGRMYSMFKK